jgi:hypothetical protein
MNKKNLNKYKYIKAMAKAADKAKDKTTIDFSWWNSEKPQAKINKETMEFLSLSALNRIKEMTSRGYTSGELCEEIEEVNYTGFWEVK